MSLTMYRKIAVAGTLAFSLTASGQTVSVGETNLNASGEMQLKWIGKGVSNKLFDAEILLSQGVIADSSKVLGPDYDGRFRLKITTLLASVYYHPPKVMDIKLCMPFLVKSGPDGVTGPFGDLSCDISRKWGESGNIGTAVNLNLPTGYSSILKTDNLTFLSPDNQLGSGLFSAAVRASYALIKEWGIINMGGSYSAGLFAIRTTEYGYDTKTDKITYDNKKFQVARDGTGARNDAGEVFPDRINIFTDFGIKTDILTHGFGIYYSYPLAPGKMETRTIRFAPKELATQTDAQQYVDASVTTGNEKNIVLARKNTDSTWAFLSKNIQTKKAIPSVLLQYNIEKSDMTFPIFLGAMVKLDYDKKLDFGGFSFGLGFKFPVY
jgi:hypothetical protein